MLKISRRDIEGGVDEKTNWKGFIYEVYIVSSNVLHELSGIR